METDVVAARLRCLAWLATVAAIVVAVALPRSAAAHASHAQAAEALVDFEDAPIGTQITTARRGVTRVPLAIARG